MREDYCMNSKDKIMIYLRPDDVLKLKDRFGTFTYLACYGIIHENLIGVLELEEKETFCGIHYEVAGVGSSYFISRNSFNCSKYLGLREIVGIYRLLPGVSLNDFFGSGKADLRMAKILYEKEDSVHEDFN